MQNLTPPQKRIFDFLCDHQRAGGPMPSIQEITDYCKYKSTRATRDHLEALERDNRISRDQRKARSISVVGEPLGSGVFDEVPIFGGIPAGTAEEQFECVQGHLRVDLSCLGIRRTSKIFALKVQGDSMTGRGIYDGDTAIIDGAATPRDGEVVVALIDNKSSLKTLVASGRKAYLKAENPNHSDIYPLLSLTVQGVAKSIIRTAL